MHAFDILGDPCRRRILELLADGELASGDVGSVIQGEFGISQPAVSQHLRVLRETGFASVRAEGARRIYAVEAERLQEVDMWLDRFRRFWEPRFDALGTELKRGQRERRKKAAEKPDPQTPLRRKANDEQPDDPAGRSRPHARDPRDRGRRGPQRDLPPHLRRARRGRVGRLHGSRAARPLVRPVSGDLRQGGNYVAAMAKGEILRCEPPRLLTLEWAGDDPANPSEQVELRLQPAAEGGTVFELEHSAIGGEFEWKGKLIDLITLLGGGWEPAFVSLDVFLHGETPPDFDLEKFRTRPEIAAVANRAEEAWTELVGRGG